MVVLQIIKLYKLKTGLIKLKKNLCHLIPTLVGKQSKRSAQLKLIIIKGQSAMWAIQPEHTALVPKNTIRNSEQASDRRGLIANIQNGILYLLTPILLLDWTQNLFAPIFIESQPTHSIFHSQPTHVIILAMLLHRTILLWVLQLSE